jgi:hypothetical protein
MHVFRNVRVVHNLYGDAPALSHPQQGAGDLVAIADRAEHNLWRQLDHHRRDPQREIRRAPGGLRAQGRHSRMRWRPRHLPLRWRLTERGPQFACPRPDHGSPSKPRKIPSIHLILIPPAMPSPARPPEAAGI